MKLKIDYIDNSILINNEIINVIEIENKKYFYRLIKDLYSIFNSEIIESIRLYSDDYQEINLSNKINIYLNFFDLSNINSKKNINDITKYMLENIEEENRKEIIKNYDLLIKNISKFINNIDIPLNISDNNNVESIFKLIKFSININNDLFNNLLLIIDLEKMLNTNKIIFFINLKQYLSSDELVELYKYSLYNDVRIILIDSQSYGCTLEYEKKLIIDDNLDEFVI